MAINVVQRFKHLAFGRAQQLAFLEDLNSLIEDGVPAQQAVVAINKVSSGLIQEVSQSIITGLGEGKTLAEGLEGWFPHHIVEVVRIGEEGGSLTNTLKSATTALAQSSSIAASFISSLVYPVVVLILASVVSIFLKHSVFDSFLEIKPINLWPENGRTLYAISSFIERYWWVVVLNIIAIIIIFAQLFRRLTGDVRAMLDKVMPFSLYRVGVAARMMETLGLLVSNGITFKDSLNILQRDTTPYVAWHIYMMQIRLGEGGENIAEVLDTGLLDKADVGRLLIIAQGKGFEYALIRLGIRAMQKSSAKLQFIGKILGGAFLALDGAFAIFMILSVYAVGMSLGGV